MTETRLLLLLLLLPTIVECGKNESMLLNDLLSNYSKEERPVNDDPEFPFDAILNNPVLLAFDLDLQQIIDLDEKNQVLTTNMWLKMEWKDPNLVWEPGAYGGVDQLSLPPDLLWTPDLLLHNSAAESFETTYHTNIQVKPDGTCYYVPPGIFKSTCVIDITWFPFDDQSCLFKFSSWTYNSYELNLTLMSPNATLATFRPNGEWQLLGFAGKRNEMKYDCCPESYVDLSYDLKIRRRTLYYFTNLILPCGVIASLAIVGFCVPPDCGEKVTLEITILMALTFYMNMVSEMMPQSSETPLIGIYFSSIMIMVANSVAATILILNYQHTVATNSAMPEWTRKLFLQWLPWALRIDRPGKKITRKSIKLQNKMRELERHDASSKSLLTNVLDLDDDLLLLKKEDHMASKQQQHLSTSPLEVELKCILKEVRLITEKIKEEGSAEGTENEWKFAAMVLDRLCLMLFTLLSAFLTVAIFMAAPHVIVW